MKKKNLILIGIAVVVVAAAAFSVISSKNEKQISTGSTAVPAVTNGNGDLEISIADITEKATFYSYDKLDSKMEVIAVKASDGTIRTAFNTCQVCYSSGRGYYVQEGDLLICQNCGNQFTMDDVEVAKGGCNPVPIFDDQKKVNGDTITIPKKFLKESEVIFKNWKV